MLHGFDLSYAQAGLSLAEIADKAGFLLLRAGYGGDYKGSGRQRIRPLRRGGGRARHPVGRVPLPYALTAADAEGEAAHMLRLLGGRKPALGVWLDMEDADGYKAKNGMPSDATLADICITFCDAMEQAGLYTGIYASLSWLETKLKTEKLGRFDKWVAQWNDTCDYTGAYSLWQYTDRYEIAGRKLGRKPPRAGFPHRQRREFHGEQKRAAC